MIFARPGAQATPTVHDSCDDGNASKKRRTTSSTGMLFEGAIATFIGLPQLVPRAAVIPLAASQSFAIKTHRKPSVFFFAVKDSPKPSWDTHVASSQQKNMVLCVDMRTHTHSASLPPLQRDVLRLLSTTGATSGSRSNGSFIAVELEARRPKLCSDGPHHDDESPLASQMLGKQPTSRLGNLALGGCGSRNLERTPGRWSLIVCESCVSMIDTRELRLVASAQQPQCAHLARGTWTERS